MIVLSGSGAAYAQSEDPAVRAAELAQQASLDRRLAKEEAWIRQGIKARRTRNEGRVRALEALRRERLERLTRAERVRMAIEELGPTFIKLAQLFSARADILPEPYLSQVGTLQDQAPPLPNQVHQELIDLQDPFPESFQGIQILLVPGAKERIDEVLQRYDIPWKSAGGVRISSPEAIPFIVRRRRSSTCPSSGSARWRRSASICIRLMGST